MWAGHSEGEVAACAREGLQSHTQSSGGERRWLAVVCRMWWSRGIPLSPDWFYFNSLIVFVTCYCELMNFCYWNCDPSGRSTDEDIWDRPFDVYYHTVTRMINVLALV